MKVWIRFCMLTHAITLSDTRHPQDIIRADYPDAADHEPQSICEAWFFRATPRDTQPQGYELAPNYTPDMR